MPHLRISQSAALHTSSSLHFLFTHGSRIWCKTKFRTDEDHENMAATATKSTWSYTWGCFQREEVESHAEAAGHGTDEVLEQKRPQCHCQVSASSCPSGLAGRSPSSASRCVLGWETAGANQPEAPLPSHSLCSLSSAHAGHHCQ